MRGPCQCDWPFCWHYQLQNAFALPPGALIAERVLASDYFRRVKRAGVYLHCARLREVDTGRLIEEAMLQGPCSPMRDSNP